jgi:hypothetical protein
MGACGNLGNLVLIIVACEQGVPCLLQMKGRNFMTS